MGARQGGVQGQIGRIPRHLLISAEVGIWGIVVAWGVGFGLTQSQ